MRRVYTRDAKIRFLIMATGCPYSSRQNDICFVIGFDFELFCVVLRFYIHSLSCFTSKDVFCLCTIHRYCCLMDEVYLTRV